MFCKSGVTILRTLVTSPEAEIITVPGEYTTPPSLYFCVIDRESFPVGMLMPKAIEKSLTASTASYKRASSPGFLQGHIQFAEQEMPFSPLSIGAKTMFANDSAIAKREPAATFTKA